MILTRWITDCIGISPTFFEMTRHYFYLCAFPLLAAALVIVLARCGAL
jgi:hypothetical protein